MKQYYFLTAALFLFTIVNAQIVTIPDANFKAQLLASSPTYHVGSNVNPNSSGAWTSIDTNQDGEIDLAEASAIVYLSVSWDNISSLQGIEAFTNLQYLGCNGNNLTSLDLSNCHLLKTILCESNQLSSINISGCVNLNSLNCSNNNLTIIDLTGLQSLTSLYVDNNSLSSLETSDLQNIRDINAYNNNLTSFSISNKSQLEELILGGNQIHTVALINLPKLFKIVFQGNNLSSLDLSGCAFQFPDVYQKIFDVYLNNNQNLTHINLKNGVINTIELGASNFSNLPQQFICVDDIDVFGSFNSYNANSLISTYCNFTPGSQFNTITGSVSYDFDNNGCDGTDINTRGIKIGINDSINGGYTYSNANGNYAFFVQQPNLTITPAFENPYFTVSPGAANLNFTSNSNLTQTQNFCITANGIHPDLEITILPIDAAIPGFDATYKVIYKNKGTHAQSGTISFAFDDAVLDFINANPIISSQSINYLNWDFTDLQPFESRDIRLSFNVNTPTEVPPVLGNDVLNFTALINTSATDEMPEDNVFILNQTVVNSFDPNDKTCLEGNTITPEMVGKYVHYKVRFENTGTANARNIVVKDMINTAKFDLNSLIPIDGSRPFVTKISSTNKVEFIFENINLPFDDANNDGYVVFKIKTKSTLVLGNSFSNTASIYFDYNFPIVTNTATTTVALLANEDFAFEHYFNIYPNPVSTVLNIEMKKTIEVTSINIYNTLGQIVLVIPNAQQTKSVDVSSLKTGNYLMKINADKGSASVKFIKM